MAKFSKRLQELSKTDPRIAEYEFDPDNDCGEHWLHLEYPLVIDGISGSIHEYTVKDCLDMLSEIICGGCYNKPCICLPDDAPCDPV